MDGSPCKIHTFSLVIISIHNFSVHNFSGNGNTPTKNVTAHGTEKPWMTDKVRADRDAAAP